MKALSIRSPWWWAILKSGKDIENRDWPTRYRGLVLIHVGKWWKDSEVREDLVSIQRILKLKNSPADDYRDLLKPYGGYIVGSVEITDCVTESTSPWFFGKYGFVLKHPIDYLNPIPYKGALGLFDVPESIVCSLQQKG